MILKEKNGGKINKPLNPFIFIGLKENEKLRYIYEIKHKKKLIKDDDAQKTIMLFNDFFKIDIENKSRHKYLILARSIFIYMMRECNYSVIKIGKYLNRDHSSICHFIKVLKDEMFFDKNMESAMLYIICLINQNKYTIEYLYSIENLNDGKERFINYLLDNYLEWQRKQANKVYKANTSV